MESGITSNDVGATMISEGTLADEFAYAVFVLGLVFIFAAQALVFLTIGYWYGRRHRQPQFWDHRPAIGEHMASSAPLVVPGYACPEPVIGRQQWTPTPLFSHPPPPPPESSIPAPVPPPPKAKSRAVPRNRRETRICGRLSDTEARLPERRFPEIVYFGEHGNCYHVWRNCTHIKGSEIVETRRMCNACELFRLAMEQGVRVQ